MGEIVHALTLRLHASGERAILTLLGYTAASLLVVFAFSAFVYAGATAMSVVYGPVVSALVTGGISIALAVIVVVWLALRRRRLQRQMRMRKFVQPAMAGVAVRLLPAIVKSSPIATLLAVAAAAYILQRVSEKRD